MTKAPETTNHRLSRRLTEILLSKTGVTTLDPKEFHDVVKDATEADAADSAAMEACLLLCKEEGMALDQRVVARVVRSCMRRLQRGSMKRDDRLAELAAALMAAGARSSGQDTLKNLEAWVLKPPRGTRLMSSRPLSARDVCQACSPDNISFLRYDVDDPADVQEQLDETKRIIRQRVDKLGGGDVEVSVVVHRGCCRVHGSEERRDGDGVAELPGVILYVDFGDGIEVEGEHEVRL